MTSLTMGVEAVDVAARVLGSPIYHHRQALLTNTDGCGKLSGMSNIKKKRSTNEHVCKGYRSGRLLVIGAVFIRRQCGSRQKHVRCRCDCGKLLSVRVSHLAAGKSKSCGCARIEAITTHGMSYTVEYGVWSRMVRRVNGAPDYQDVHLCDRWKHFENFYEDMGQAPKWRRLSIDRINNDPAIGYRPSNCRWADQYIQMANKRTTFMVTYEGKRRALCELARGNGTRPSLARARVGRGWPVELAITAPERARLKDYDV